MTAVRLYFDGDRVGPLFQRAVTRQGERVRASARLAVKDMVQDVKDEAAVDMATAGNFGSRWTQGLEADVGEGGGNIRVAFWHDVPYFSVFQYGAVIHGKPMLWIPLSFAKDAQAIWARDYAMMSAIAQNPNTPRRAGLFRAIAPAYGLFRVNRAGKAPLLFSRADRKPKYFGKESVTIKKTFHVVEIIREAARHLSDYYRNRFSETEE